MKRVFLMMLAICTLAGCSKDNGDETPKNIEITGGKTTQEVFADNTQGKEGVRFTTTGAWTSSIAATTKAEVPDWVSIDPASGDKAGDYTINIILTPNYTGENRKAEIKISCGGTVITITVEQKGTTQSGEKPEAVATYITSEGKIKGGEILGENLPSELKWLMMRMDDTSVDHYSPTSYPYTGQTFNITLPTPSAELLGAFVAEHDNTKDFTVVPSSAKFSHSALDYDGGDLIMTNISWQDENNSNYKMKKGDGYVEFVYASEAVTINGAIINKDDLTQQRTYQFTNCTFRQGWNEMVMIAESDATSNGPQIFNITTNNAPATFKWVAQSYNFEPGVRLVTKITDWYRDNKEKYTQETIFSYDDQNRITAAKLTLVGVPESDFMDKYTWEYNDNTVICKRHFLDKGDTGDVYTVTATSTFSLNTDGSVKSATKTRIQKQGETVMDAYDGTKTYTYADGFLTQQYEKGEGRYGNDVTYKNDQKLAITWKDGNRTREDLAGNKWYAKYEYKDRYDKISNIDLIHITMKLDEMEIVPLSLGRRPQDLISKMSDFYGVVTNGEVAYSQYDYNYDYEYDSMGFVVKINETTSSGSQNSTTITYGN